jgi:ATP-dependent HslUV protease ATP-binding subunit HslU
VKNAAAQPAAGEASPPVPPSDGSVPTLAERTTDTGATERVLVVSSEYVQQQVAGIVKNQDLSRYIL